MALKGLSDKGKCTVWTQNLTSLFIDTQKKDIV